MDQFVEWDADTSAVVTGPQGVKGGVDNWYPLVEGPEEQNPETQTVEYYFDEDQQVVTWRVTGDPYTDSDPVKAMGVPKLRRSVGHALARH